MPRYELVHGGPVDWARVDTALAERNDVVLLLMKRLRALYELGADEGVEYGEGPHAQEYEQVEDALIQFGVGAIGLNHAKRGDYIL